MEEHFGFSELAKKATLQPKEALLEKTNANHCLYIGVPKETTLQEGRIPLTPSSVQLLVNNGNEVWIESNAGKNAHFSDTDYSESGAKICYSKEEVFKANIILKVEPPTTEEIALLTPNHVLISALQHASKNSEFIKSLMQKKLTAISYENLKDNDGLFPVIRSLSEIAGITSISIADELLSSSFGGKGEMLGGATGIPPTEIVIIGAGTVGEYAAKVALGKGANVKIFDHSLSKLRRIQDNLKMPVFTSLLHPKIISKALQTADVAIGCLRSETGRSPIIVSEEIVSQMKNKAVIIDLSIDQGGIFETSETTTHKTPTFVKHNVIHYCVPNITSRVCRTASYALSNVFAPLILKLSNAKDLQTFLFNNPGARSGIYMYKGNLTNKHIGQQLNIYHKDLDLLIAAHI
jgi:alanine dehydrogenase